VDRVNRRLFVLASLALGGCASVGAAPPAAPPPAALPPPPATPTPATPATPAAPPGPLAELEPLRSARATREGLSIRVASQGCTAKPDFAFYVERRAGSASLAFGRRHVDTCKRPGGEAEIVFSWSELGLDPKAPVFVLNPLGPS
jgi:hypothetical protein